MLRKVVCGLAAVALVWPLMLARQGMMSGDARVYADAPAAPDSPETITAEVRENLKKLAGSSDVAPRITMAKYAIEKQAWEGAKLALEDAARLDPKNTEIATLMEQVRPHLVVIPTTVPATNPTVVTPSTTPAVKPAPAGGSFTARRMLTPAEINRIKQIELQPGEKLHVKIDAETKKKFLDSTAEITRNEFNKLTPEEQADLILTKGKPEFHKGVAFTEDPATIGEFKKVERVITQSCASASCHTGPKAGNFVLYLGSSPAVLYTNYLVLQKYTMNVKGVERSMIDRDFPESSLLLQFMLDPLISDAPHPRVAAYHPPIRKKDDRRYLLLLSWIKTLNPIMPKYGIDLSSETPAETDPKKPAAGTPAKTSGGTPPRAFAK